MHPVIFETKFFILYTFWIFFAAGIFLTIFSIIKLGNRSGLKIAFLSENSGKIVLFSLIGARIFSLIENYSVYFTSLSWTNFFRLFYFWDKGLNIWGALLGGLLALYFLCKKNDQDFFKWLDTLIPSIIIGLSLGHLGAFFEGINYGTPTSLPWGVNFESPNIKYTVPIHPTQIYAFIYSTTIASFLVLLSQSEKIKNAKNTGLIGLIGVTSYGFLSFLEEFLRGDDTLVIWEIRVSQVLTLLITIFAGIFLYLRYNGATLSSKLKSLKQLLKWKK